MKSRKVCNIISCLACLGFLLVSLAGAAELPRSFVQASTKASAASRSGSSSRSNSSTEDNTVSVQGSTDEERIAKIKEEDTPELNWRVTDGWTLPENNIYRNYLCRFGALDVPCWDSLGLYPDSEYQGWPVPIYCPPGTCCDDVMGDLRCRSSCVTGGWTVMAATNCTCKLHGYKCPENTVCDEQDTTPYGGVYCRCKDGYVGDGAVCYPDPCADSNKNRCSPGQCKGRPNGTAYCICPKGYTWDDSDLLSPACVLESLCKDDPCGPAEAVLECRTDSTTEYTCICRPGYEVGSVEGKKMCIEASAAVTCKDEPCGTEGLLSCTDTPSGPECQCKTFYRLVTEQRKKQCIYSPCEYEPCGDAVAAKSCQAGMSTYTCVCNSNYKLDTVDGQPKCVASTEDLTLFIIGATIVGVLLLISVVSCFILRRRMLMRNALEAYTQDSLEVSMGAHQDGLRASTSAWM
ncbi:hypothetical protein EBH_0018570 [Eimeria brunetti]|uniref:EGF-like domain-containing protein n=1 Tax=Eimeria brunetti TaxID=51314 RepID=U6LTC4_9EIME|nr:hypothetical protein EBH_0018570 [Eimeria brunetti]